MAMQTDVKVSKVLTSTGAFKNNAGSPTNIGSCRIKAIYASASTNGTLAINDGNGGAVLLPAVALAAGAYLLLPGEGIWAPTSPYGTITGTLSVVIVYG